MEWHVKEHVGKLEVFKSTEADGTSSEVQWVSARIVSKPLAGITKDSTQFPLREEGRQTPNPVLSREENKDVEVLTFGNKLGQIH